MLGWKAALIVRQMVNVDAGLELTLQVLTPRSAAHTLPQTPSSGHWVVARIVVSIDQSRKVRGPILVSNPGSILASAEAGKSDHRLEMRVVPGADGHPLMYRFVGHDESRLDRQARAITSKKSSQTR